MEQIIKTYGELGITYFEECYGRKVAITDDTQMTLFTAEGILRAECRVVYRGMNIPENTVRRLAMKTNSRHVDLMLVIAFVIVLISGMAILPCQASAAGGPTEAQMRAAVEVFNEIWVRSTNMDWGRRGALRIIPIYFKKKSCVALNPGLKYECTYVSAQKMVGPMADMPWARANNEQMMIKREGVGIFVYRGKGVWKFISTAND